VHATKNMIPQYKNNQNSQNTGSWSR